MLFRKFTGAFLAAAVVLGAAFAVHRAAASQGERRSRERWEHCALVVSGTVLTEGERRTGVASLCHFRGGKADRCEEIRVPFALVGERFSPEAVQIQTAASAISRLGNEGWQLVEVAPADAFGVTGGTQAFYFKRTVD